MSNSIKTKTKNIFLIIVLALGLLLTSFTGLYFNPRSSVSATVDNKITKDVTSSAFSSSYNFKTSSTSKPVKPSGWSEISNNIVNEGNIVRGIVDVKEESTSSFDTEVYKTTKPTMPNHNSTNDTYFKNLMINSPDGVSGRMGYESTNSIKLEADSFYAVSVFLYTQKTSSTDKVTESDAKASIYLTGITDDKKDENYKQSKFEYFSTLGNWQTYTFYIDTNTAISPKLELWLGSQNYDCQGAVFFNEIKITRFSEDYYVENILTLDDTETNNFNIISLSEANLTSENSDSYIGNGGFEEGLSNWSQKAFSSESTQIQKVVNPSSISTINEDLTITTPGSNCSPYNQRALFMYNKEDDYQSIESANIIFEAQKYYKLTFWAKSDCNIGSGATVKLVDKSENNAISDSSLTLSSTFTKDSNTFRNDWTKYSFYIYGPATQTTPCAIQICLGTNTSKTSGYVFIDDFRLYEIDYSTYSSNSSNTNATTFNLNDKADKYTVANGNFDKTQNETSPIKYPLKPASWEKSGQSNSTTFSGVINASKNTFSNTNISALPLANNNDNNVLMIGSTNETNSQSFVSSEISLDANNYYTISMYVITDYTQNTNLLNSGARVTISSSTKTIFDLYNIYYQTNNWQKITVYIKTSNIAETANIKLTFNGNGFVFFDDVRLVTINEGIYNEATPVISQTYKVDLTKENFDNRTFNKVSTNSLGLETPNNWTGSEANENTNTVSTGIISANNSLLNNISSSLSGNNTYLYISAHEDVNYSYTSKDTYTFDAGTYYKISVNILTRYLQLDKEYEEEFDLGASISLSSSSDVYFKGISTNSEWSTYVIYLNPETSITSSIKLSLGYNENPTSGQVLFDNLVITKLTDSAAYENDLKNYYDENVVSFINYSDPTDTDTEKTPSTWTNTLDQIMVIVPSIITALAIVIAIIGFYLKRFNLKRKPKIKTNYDRRKTLDKDIDRREKIELRQQIISELNSELDSIDKEIEEFNKLAEEKISEVKAKITAEQNEIKKQKLDIEIKKKEATAERQKQLKDNPEFVSNTKAEKEYSNYIARLDKQELSLQKKLADKEIQLENAKQINKDKLAKYLERKEFIRNEIAKIEAEIEQIAKEEEQMWAEYRAAKADAKRRKAEYKAQIKSEKLIKKNSAKSKKSK